MATAWRLGTLDGSTWLDLRTLAINIRDAGSWDGFAANINRLAPGTDFGPLLAQLPGGDCPVPHWGYMIEGSITVHYRDGDEETVDAGQIFHLPAHHDRLVTATGALYAEFSPADAAHRLLAEVALVMGAAQPGRDQ